VHRLRAERLQDQHIERPLNYVGIVVVHTRIIRTLIMSVKM
jgi:hypothetical protein